MKQVTATLTIRVTMLIPETMSAHEACSELNYEITGDEDDVIEVIDTEITDSETTDE
jgi:hypothetical protein